MIRVDFTPYQKVRRLLITPTLGEHSPIAGMPSVDGLVPFESSIIEVEVRWDGVPIPCSVELEQ